eukprot:9652-Eustigmatos_ZCMA.PRE.1
MESDLADRHAKELQGFATRPNGQDAAADVGSASQYTYSFEWVCVHCDNHACLRTDIHTDIRTYMYTRTYMYVEEDVYGI